MTELLKTASWPMLILALIFFNLSKWLGAWRLQGLFQIINVPITFLHNLRLFYVGMFYNLFLPGGIGGDAYKVIYIKDTFKKSTRSIFSVILYDRLNGLGILIGLAAVLLVMDSIPFPDEWMLFAAWSLLAAVIPMAYLLTRVFFRSLLPVVWQASFRSLLSQLAQLVTAYFILVAIGVDDLFKAYLLLFLLSSIATIIPITFGGIGLRELVFLWASDYAGIDVDKAVALGLIFFLITAFSSFIGVFVKIDSENGKRKGQRSIT